MTSRRGKKFFTLPKESLVYILLTTSLGFAAINTGNNLLYLVLAMMLSFIIVSGFLSKITLRKLSIQLTMPEDIFAGQPFPLEIQVTNRKRHLPTYSITVEPVAQGLKAPICYAVKIPPQGTVTFWQEATFERRGQYQLEGFKVTTRYPFSLFEKGKYKGEKRMVVVYPKVENLAFFPIDSHLEEEVSSLERNLRGHGTNLYGIKPYALGDNSKRIAWRLSAKERQLVVRQFEKEEAKRLCLLIDNKRGSSHEAFEKVISLAASLIQYLMRRDFQVKVVTLHEVLPYAPPNAKQLRRLWHFLALLEPVDGAGVDLCEPTLLENSLGLLIYPEGEREAKYRVLSQVATL